MNISEMLARNARMFPEDIALVERVPSKNIRKEITWKQFDERVNRLANALITRGVGKGDRVLHWMMNSINWLEAYFGIVRTGAIATPLNFRFTERDFNYCADVAEPKAVILDEWFCDKVRAVSHPLLPVQMCIVNGQAVLPGMENFEDVIAESDPSSVKIEIGDEEPCGLYFTSGTTGVPKPILLTHKNMECAAITEVVHGLRRPGDIWVTLIPFYHTGDWIHWLASLILGEPSVIQGDKITPIAIFEVIHKERGAESLFSEAFFERKIKSVTCFQCPIGCSRVVRTKEGKTDITTEGPEYETIYAFGSNCGIDDPNTIIEADLLREEYGLDTISCGVVLSFIMECSEKIFFKWSL